jgi:hypothetical protein
MKYTIQTFARCAAHTTLLLALLSVVSCSRQADSSAADAAAPASGTAAAAGAGTPDPSAAGGASRLIDAPEAADVPVRILDPRRRNPPRDEHRARSDASLRAGGRGELRRAPERTGIGAVIEGGEGAAVGAGAGTAAAAASSGNQVIASAGSKLTFTLSRPLTVTVLVV